MAASLALPSNSGRGKTVAILGAGVAGLCAAYELDRAGYDCVILEAARRAGGRSLTLRRGDVVKEIGAPEQVCDFDDGLWMNAGPGRIPHHHVHVIDYCRKFGVALQPYIFAKPRQPCALRLRRQRQDGAGAPRAVRPAGPRRRTAGEVRGNAGHRSGAVRRRPRKTAGHAGEFRRPHQGRNAGKRSWSYQNQSGRAGYETPPGLASEPGRPLSPLALDEILRSNVWNDWIFREAEYYWQASLLEPVGGMDHFFQAFLRQPLARQSGTIDGLIRYGARVIAVAVGSDKVRLLYDEGGSPQTTRGRLLHLTIPMPIFADLQTNLPAAFMEAARNLKLMPAGKVGWQAERFWEDAGPNLRRHLVDDRHHHPDLVSVVRLSQPRRAC